MPGKSPGRGREWIAVDLDGTLAKYYRGNGPESIGAPVPAMVRRVRRWLADGRDVRIFTARAGNKRARAAIREWLAAAGLPKLPITNQKDPHCVAIYDDRAHQVRRNTGALVNRADDVSVAGLCVRALDTGRVLLLQRALSDDDPAAGTWDFPGGHLEPGESSIDAARREWTEETGIIAPAGDPVAAWRSGIYECHVVDVPHEADVSINPPTDDRPAINPDDPDGDQTEAVAFWNPADLLTLTALRAELRSSFAKWFPLVALAPIENASPRSDAQRRAMFARLRGGSTPAPADWKTRAASAPDAPSQIAPATYAKGQARLRAAEYLDRPEWRAGDYTQDQWESLPKQDRQRLSLVTGVPTFAPMPAAAPATWKALLQSKAAKNALASLVTGISSGIIDKYRSTNKTMDPGTERALAKIQALLSTVSALTGLASAKTVARKATGHSLDKSIQFLEDKGTKLAAYARRATAGVPAPIKSAAASTHKAYSTLADFTGGTITDLLSLPTVARNLRSTNPADVRAAIGSLAKAGTIIAGAAAIEGFEAKQIADYKDAISDAWDHGKDYKLPADPQILNSPLALAGMALVSSLGNPIERQFRSYFGGKYTKDLADYAAYSLQHDRIDKMEKAGVLSPESAEAAREKNADWKPWNMAGRSVYTFSPAAANFLKWKVGDFIESVTKPMQFARVKEVYDADTVVLEDGKPSGVRFIGIDAPETDKPGKKGDYLGFESAQWATNSLLGRVVRVVQNPDHPTEKWGRDIGFVETLPRPLDKLLLVPGLNRILPAIDWNKQTILEGFAQPNAGHIRLPGARHERLAEYDAAVVDARERAVGIQSPEGFAQYQVDRPYTPKIPVPKTPIEKAGVYLGLGLMTSGQSGAFGAMGEAGGGLAQLWNATMAGLGAYEQFSGGPSNTGRVYRLPKNYATDYELRAK